MRTLYWNELSPYSRKVRVMLAEKGLDFEINDPPREQRLHDPYAKNINPCARVPVLDDNGLILFESNVILDYLLTQYPETPRNAPQPPLVKSLVRPEKRWYDQETLVAIETMLDSGINLLQFHRIGIRPSEFDQIGVGSSESSFLGREATRIQRILDWLEKRATPEGFVPAQFSVLDLNFVITVQWNEIRKMFEWRGRPTLEKLVAFHQNRPTLLAAYPKVPERDVMPHFRTA
jgi:glutathione S-transferase